VLAQANREENKRWTNTRLSGETIEQWRQRQQLEDQMRLLHGMMLMWENQPAAQEQYNHAQARLTALKEKYECKSN
jgi:hypothetical protein